MLQPKVAYVGIPYTNHVEPATLRSVYETIVNPKRAERGAVLDGVSCSVLPHSFNVLWARCLNNEGSIPAGMTYSYFCLLHSDVVPQTPYWLDVLIDEMEANGGDVIHACVAIKSNEGWTSTALGETDDPWYRHRKITLTELRWLGEKTFDLADLMESLPDPRRGFREPVLCPNTGLMVVKLGPWCRDFPGFEILSRVVERDGKMVAEFSPEDWNFGRWCAGQGLRVLGTTKVKTSHFGIRPHSTMAAWGEATDRAFFDATERDVGGLLHS